jgi:hypothetical protein
LVVASMAKTLFVTEGHRTRTIFLQFTMRDILMAYSDEI